MTMSYIKIPGDIEKEVLRLLKKNWEIKEKIPLKAKCLQLKE